MPDPELSGTTIVYAVRLDYFGKMSKKDQQRLIDANPQANKKAPVFYVGQTSLEAWQRYENHRNGYKAGRGWVKKSGFHSSSRIRCGAAGADHQSRLAVGPAQ